MIQPADITDPKNALQVITPGGAALKIVVRTLARFPRMIAVAFALIEADIAIHLIFAGRHWDAAIFSVVFGFAWCTTLIILRELDAGLNRTERGE